MSTLLSLRRLVILLLPISITLTAYLYLYPIFHGCSFPTPDGSHAGAFSRTAADHAGLPLPSNNNFAPFRLLALGDPQLEGDSSIPSSTKPLAPFLEGLRVDPKDSQSAFASWLNLPRRGLVYILQDIPLSLKKWRKHLDLVGNDYYLAHIYRAIHWWTNPTHVTVLGDLLGSQWVTDEEFALRGSRFWERVFPGSQRVEDDITNGTNIDILGGNGTSWSNRLMNIVGNHDIGYGGDIVASRVERFERTFGKINWNVRFQLPGSSPDENRTDSVDEAVELRIVILNTLNLDSPVYDQRLQGETYNFLNEVILSSRDVQDKKVATVLLTHVPLHKDQGVCVDGPFFAYNEQRYGGGISEQNHLSYEASKSILESLYGMSPDPNAVGRGLGRQGIILTGHDHAGCDVYHHVPPLSPEQDTDRRWKAVPWSDSAAVASAESIPGIREVTVRSMMGDFGGNAGLLSGWFDINTSTWRFEYTTCALGTQHIWWMIHIIDLVTVIGILVLISSSIYEIVAPDLSPNGSVKRPLTAKGRAKDAPNDDTEDMRRTKDAIEKGPARKRHSRCTRD
ncbi:MAG: hypothetical protein M1837_001945 [Sclerophora amabilis]|nr:MAG: hypothetical protein M1837_001945 [Sclerophora amabilis]